MSETGNADMPERWQLALATLHGVQLVFSIIALGLAAYGVRYIAYNVLVYTLVTICTLIVCAYLIASRTYLRKIYWPYVDAAYHAWMLLFWVVDLGLLARLAYLWQGPQCAYDYRNGFTCVPYEKRSGTTTYGRFYGALVAGAVLAAFEFSLWIVTSAINWVDARRNKRTARDKEGDFQPRLEHESSSAAEPSCGLELQSTDDWRATSPDHSPQFDEIPITPPQAPWEFPESQIQRPGPQPLIDNDEHGFSKRDLGAARATLKELDDHSTPLAVFVVEQEGQATSLPRPLVPTYQVGRSDFRVTNVSDDDSTFVIGE
ncbi:hypothetical protein EK21DRAFT_110198 [Setomelanomma holmii]|uniref:MARVEL domain-containing protein n=1 Tax=Setomelanomma holmii TaxID=210430 RepID=A0A9P4HET6_9PLEO|nr:hypothetical protein EK21DRAFT_110198 [Setomelanomma holmii]